MNQFSDHHFVESRDTCNILHLISTDRMNRLAGERVLVLTKAVEELRGDAACCVSAQKHECKPLIITGNKHYFSVGADLNEISKLDGAMAFDFAKMGQRLMSLIDDFPAPVYAAVSGYCMGGGLDLALACDFRICAANTTFGHRGAALGLITGWGGTQRLPRIVGRARASRMFVAAEKLGAAEALEIGLVSEIVSDPLGHAIQLAMERHRMELSG